MDVVVIALVLLAAALHASWNALLKSGGDPFVRLAVVNVVSGLCALPVLPLLTVPAPASWPYLLASVVIHHAYYIALSFGYRVGDLSHVYPIARGVAPPLVVLGAWLMAGENPGLIGALAILLISGAIISLTFGAGWRIGPLAPVGLALATGVSIAGYTICDGMGGRASGDVFGYIAWLFVLDAIPFAILVALYRRRTVRRDLEQSWRAGVLGGILAIAAYGLVIWAMSLSPMGHVSALRETSVVVAAWLGARVLREPLGARRMLAAGLVAAGVVLLYVGGAT